MLSCAQNRTVWMHFIRFKKNSNSLSLCLRADILLYFHRDELHQNGAGCILICEYESHIWIIRLIVNSNSHTIQLNVAEEHIKNFYLHCFSSFISSFINSLVFIKRNRFDWMKFSKYFQFAWRWRNYDEMCIISLSIDVTTVTNLSFEYSSILFVSRIIDRFELNWWMKLKLHSMNNQCWQMK